MTIPHWQLEKPVSAIVFDCDGTLSTIEGIDALAKNNGTEDSVQAMTADAMGKTGLNPALYEKRLDLVYPDEKHVFALGLHYFHHQVPHAKEVIALFQRLKKSVYIVSAGLFPSVRIFGGLLEVPRDNIFAVNVYFDHEGHYTDFDRSSPLIHSDGKRSIITEIKKSHPELIYVGDGLNDVAVRDLVTRFIGYGGSFYRENIAKLCEFYIRYPSMSALLPLALTEEENQLLTSDEKSLYQQGLTHLTNDSPT